MSRALFLAILASASAAPHEGRVPVGSASLYARDIGRGQPIVVLHGGPDFDHSYLLPDMDRLMADTWSLDGYDLMPRLRSLTIPTLVIYGDHDFIPSFVAAHVAEALPAAASSR